MIYMLIVSAEWAAVGIGEGENNDFSKVKRNAVHFIFIFKNENNNSNNKRAYNFWESIALSSWPNQRFNHSLI